MYGDNPLGRRVLGRADVIAGVPVPDIAEYHGARYTADNIVVAAAGHIGHADIVDLSERLLAGAGKGPAAGPESNGASEQARLRFYAKETEQYHICFGGPGISRGDDRRFTLGILDTIFGGSVSSRLFREVREKRGLAYSVGSYTSEYVDRGFVAMYVGTRADNVSEACEIIGRELSSLHAEGLDDSEITRAKEHVKGRMVLGLESSAARMSRCARSVLFDIELYTLDELLARIDGVTADDVTALADEFYDPEDLSAACIGADEECFKAAVGAVNPSLAA
jgi:predicted Zn-dependent peptidase